MDEFDSQHEFSISPEFIRKIMPFAWIIFVVEGLSLIYRIFNKFRYADAFSYGSEFAGMVDWLFIGGTALALILGIRMLTGIDSAIKSGDPQQFEEGQKKFQGYLTLIAILTAAQFLFYIGNSFFY